MNEQLVVFNGIDESTGGYALSPMNLRDIARVVGQVDQRRYDDINALKASDQRLRVGGRHQGLIDDVDPVDLAQAGWGVIFPRDLPDHAGTELRLALKPLLDRRREQAQARYKEYSGYDGYCKDDTARSWLVRHSASPAEQADPEIVPYYLLIVGGPDAIPYSFQYSLDVIYAVGRLHFDQLPQESLDANLTRYSNYATSVVRSEESLRTQRRAVFFAPTHPDDTATQRSLAELVVPLLGGLHDKHADWVIDQVQGAAATRQSLANVVNGAQGQSLLFTASHGLILKPDDPNLPAAQGALVCADWPGPEEWQGRGRLPADYYFAGADVAATAQLGGMIACHFACFGAGAPQYDEYEFAPGRQRQIAPGPLVARLPQELLAHPNGGVLAVLSHVDRAWTYSFNFAGLVAQTNSFRDAMSRLMQGLPVGWATERINQRYSSLAAALSELLGAIHLSKRVPDLDLVSLWAANNDARGYVVLGDPAVRLSLAARGA